jgi:hypothetical protein
MISKEQYAHIIYSNHTASKYTYKELSRYLDLQCGTNCDDAYRADISIHQLGRRYIAIVVTASESFLYGPFASKLEAETTALDNHAYDGPSNEEIMYYLPHGFRTVEMVDEILHTIGNITLLGYLSIYTHRRNEKLTYISHGGYIRNRNEILIACVETNRIFSEAHARVALYQALQYERNHINCTSDYDEYASE